MSEHTCISYRLRRTTHEDAYVAVPVTDAIMKKDPEADGSFRIDFDAFRREAIRLSEDPSVDWQVEGRSLEPHPTQRAAPEGRVLFDIHR